MAVVANVAINIDGKQAAAVLDEIKRKVEAMNGTFGKTPQAAKSIDGIKGALIGLVGQFATVATAATVFQKSLSTAFERGAAEQRLKNIATSAGEYQAALAVAASTASKFGMSQTEATQALADVYGRLKGVGFGLKETSQIYEGFNVIAKQSGLAASDAAGVFFQLSQALGKGKLNGDEFISVSERMPQLLDAIATATGRSRGELAQMAQDGKITSDVLYKALAASATAAGDLNSKLTDQQKAFNALGQISDKLLNSIGQVFAPLVIKGAEALAWAGQKLGEWWDYLGAKVLPKVYAALKPAINEFQKIWNGIPWDTLIGYIQGALIKALDGVVMSLKIIGPILGYILQKWAALAQNPVFKFISEQVLGLIERLGLSNNEVAKFTEQQNAAKTAAAATVQQYTSMPEKIQTAAEANKSFAESTNLVLSNVKEQQLSIDAQIASLERGASINTARLDAEKSINDLYGQQLERAYELAGSAQERLNIAVRIFEQQVQAAQIEYRQAYDAIALEQRKLQLQTESQQLKLKEIEAEGQLAILKSKDAQQANEKKEQLKQALAAQQQVVAAAQEQTQAQQQIADYQKQSADAQYQSKVLAAQTALEQKLVSEKVGLSQADAVRLSENLAIGARQSGALAVSTNQVANNANAAAGNFIRVATEAERAASAINRAADAQQRLNSSQGGSSAPAVGAANGAYWTGGFKAFAKGGMVTKPTLGLIGEGGEAEYIIPESKAMGFAANYLLGSRGGAAIPRFAEGGIIGTPSVNIQTGPVTQMGGTNYVTTQEMGRAVQAGVRQTLDIIRSDIGARSAMGLM